MEGVPELQAPTRISVGDTLNLVTLTLWDEESQRLVRFRDLKRLTQKRAA